MVSKENEVKSEMTTDTVTKATDKIKRPKRPRHPYLKKAPEEYEEVTIRIEIRDGSTLRELLERLPHQINHDELKFGNDYYDDDEECCYLSYRAQKKNAAYTEQLASYEKDLLSYNERMVIYKEEKRLYDEWNDLSDEEKLSRDRDNKILQAKKKIILLEQHLKTLELDTKSSMADQDINTE